MRDMVALHRRYYIQWALVGLLLAAFALRVFTITTQSLWRDEVDALRFASAPWRDILHTIEEPGWNGPLYFIFLRGWVELTGRSEFALRYFSLLFGVIAVALAWALGRRLSSWITALALAGLFTLSPYFIWYSQEAKMYTLVLALAVLAVYALHRALLGCSTFRRRMGWWAVVVVGTSLAIYCHILAALLIPVEMVLALVWGPRSHRSGWWVGAGLAFAWLTFPYLPALRWELPLVFKPAQTGYAFYPFNQILFEMLNRFGTGVSGLVRTTALWPFVLLLVAGIVWGQAAWTDRALLLVWLLVPPLAIFLISLNHPLFTDRYLIWIGPAFYLLVAMGAMAIARLWKPLGVVAFAAIAGILLAGTYFQSAVQIKSDVRDATHYMEAHLAPDDLVIFQIPYMHYSFEYYDPHPMQWREGLYTNYGMSEADVDKQMRELIAGHQTVWLFASEMAMWDNRLLVYHWLESHGRQTDRADFTLVSVYRFQFDP